MKQNYLQYDQNIYQPRKGIAMGSPISGLIAEIFLQYYEQHIVKNNLDSNIITYYNRYVDDILVIYDSLKTNTNDITNFMNSLHKGLQFKATEETNGNISFLDLMITRAHNTLSINIYRKPTTTDLTIHYKSNHPLQHKTAAYSYMLNRLHNLSLSKLQKEQGLNNIFYIARQNGYPFTLISKLNKNILNRNNSTIDKHIQEGKKTWVVFEYHNPIIRKVTNIFRSSNLKIAYRTSNTTQNILKQNRDTNDIYANSGIYSLQCRTCQKHYIGQTGLA